MSLLNVYVFQKTIKLGRRAQILILLLHLSMLQMPIFILVFLHPPCKIMVMFLWLDRKMMTYREDPRDKKLVQGQEKKERQFSVLVLWENWLVHWGNALWCFYFEEINVICSREMPLESGDCLCNKDYFLLNFCRKQFQDMECEMCVSGKFNTNIPFPNFARK